MAKYRRIKNARLPNNVKLTRKQTLALISLYVACGELRGTDAEGVVVVNRDVFSGVYAATVFAAKVMEGE